jgi:hypothetical protein
MTDQPLSPAAQAVWHAYETTNCDPYLIDPRRAGVAAALRAAVDQVVPQRRKPLYADSSEESAWSAQQDTREELLAIAAELD